MDHMMPLTCVSFSYLSKAPWPSGRASDSGAKVGGSILTRVAVLYPFQSKIHLPPKKVLVIPRKRWLSPDMTEKLLTGM